MAETIHDGAVGGARHASAKPAPCHFPICLMKPNLLPVSVRCPFCVMPSRLLPDSGWRRCPKISQPGARRRCHGVFRVYRRRTGPATTTPSTSNSNGSRAARDRLCAGRRVIILGLASLSGRTQASRCACHLRRPAREIDRGRDHAEQLRSVRRHRARARRLPIARATAAATPSTDACDTANRSSFSRGCRTTRSAAHAARACARAPRRPAAAGAARPRATAARAREGEQRAPLSSRACPARVVEVFEIVEQACRHLVVGAWRHGRGEHRRCRCRAQPRAADEHGDEIEQVSNWLVEQAELAPNFGAASLRLTAAMPMTSAATRGGDRALRARGRPRRSPAVAGAHRWTTATTTAAQRSYNLYGSAHRDRAYRRVPVLDLPKAPEPIPEEKPTPPDYEAQLLDLLREYRRIATEIRDVGKAIARRAWADTRQGQLWQEGDSHFESDHGEIKEESVEELKNLQKQRRAELELVATRSTSCAARVWAPISRTP